MGVSQWQARQPLPGARQQTVATGSDDAINVTDGSEASAVLRQELILLIPQRSWQKAPVRVFLEQLTCSVPGLRYEIEDSALLQQGPYWGMGVLQTDVAENLPKVERFIASAALKKRLWQKLWRWKKTSSSP